MVIGYPYLLVETVSHAVFRFPYLVVESFISKFGSCFIQPGYCHILKLDLRQFSQSVHMRFGVLPGSEHPVRTVYAIPLMRR